MASFAVVRLPSPSSSSSLYLSRSSSSSPSSFPPFKLNGIPPYKYALVCKLFRVKASASVDFSTTSTAADKLYSASKDGNWEWKFKDSSLKIYYEEHGKETQEPSKDILMIPTISDVSTVEEWRSVAKDIVERSGKLNYRATIVDWPGLGYSDRPRLDYNADVMEKFLVDFINSRDSPICTSGKDLVVFGGGHAATILIRAAKKGLVKPAAIAAVAPTWAGPLPIVFGRDSNMETRYGFLRGTLRAPAVGWMMYNILVSNEKAIESQYKSHVFADPENVTQSMIDSRYELTTRKGSRYVPAAFLTGLLDPVKSREEFVELFAGLEGKIPVLVISTSGSPKRSKAEMEALRNAVGVSKFVEVPGALLPHEEYPKVVAEELFQFLQDVEFKA